eukprot:CAMPEP_0202415638 /NCGR_PEP_ID=MMETSP1128-20130828/36848_1 /ASSEMBLY_ACC=CAM_ASM_000463 /TAXON_ID=3047 /ORGANISM="Dunaliella tertiolecta, Strain CCMP1320" /LENGTH=47 /DNA_ID= /DNA_START= /DNA_END= /DNA_ORIENTATION=
MRARTTLSTACAGFTCSVRKGEMYRSQSVRDRPRKSVMSLEALLKWE